MNLLPPLLQAIHLFTCYKGLSYADTLGNSLGTIAAIFIPVALLTNNRRFGLPLIKLIAIAVIIYELGQPLSGKQIDPWDVWATILTKAICFIVFKLLFKETLS